MLFNTADVDATAWKRDFVTERHVRSHRWRLQGPWQSRGRLNQSDGSVWTSRGPMWKIGGG